MVRPQRFRSRVDTGDTWLRRRSSWSAIASPPTARRDFPGMRKPHSVDRTALLFIYPLSRKILRGFAIRGIERWPVARIEVACPCPSNATGLGSHMAHLITFTTARFDISKEPPNPINPIAGHGVLTWLREELLRAHYRVSEPDTEDWGWYIYVDGAGASYLVGASGAADDAGAPVEWTIQVHRNRSMKDRVLGRNKLAVDDSLFAIIERTIRGESSIEQVEVTRAV